jgi:hypothetical protein
MPLTFVEDTHTYYLDGVRLPGVSEILSRFVPQYPPGSYRELGSAVHLATLLWDRGELEEVGSAIAPRLAAYKKLREEVPMRIIHRESPLYHRSLMYAGTPDIAAEETKFGGRVIFDLKCSDSKPSKHYALQTAAYAGLCFPEPEDVTRVIINLRSNGEWEPFLFTRHDDWAAFCGAVALHKWERS